MKVLLDIYYTNTIMKYLWLLHTTSEYNWKIHRKQEPNRFGFRGFC